MKIYLANFIRNLARYFSDNRARIIKAFLIAAAVIAAILLIVAGVERWQKARYETRVQALESQAQAADANAREAEQQANAIAHLLEAKQTELLELETRADAAETALQNTRRYVAPLKEAYEQARTAPMPATPISCADACTELAGLGYPCK
jgi:uncharacterized protein HemX